MFACCYPQMNDDDTTKRYKLRKFYKKRKTVYEILCLQKDKANGFSSKERI